MSIEETKLCKKYIESPQVRLNEVHSDFLYLGGINITNGLINKQSIVREDQITTTGLFGNGSNAIRVRAFSMKASDYVGKNLQQIIVYKGTGHEFGDSDFASVANNPDGVWLFADCIHYNENEDGTKTQEIVDTFFSVNRTNQVGESTEETTAIWQFSPLQIKQEYDIIRFRLTNEYKTPIRPTGGNNSHALLLKSSRYGGDGWNSINQNASNEIQQTAKFGFVFVSFQSGMSYHISNTSIHVSEQDRQELQNMNTHMNNSSIHISQEDRTKLENLNNSSGNFASHISNTSIHMSSAQKSTIASHLGNNNIHLSSSDKNKLSNLSSNLQNITKYVETSITGFETLLNGENTDTMERNTKDIFGATSSAARIHAFFLNCNNYIGEFLQSITLLRKDIPWDSTDTAHNQPVYLYAQCLNSNGEQIALYVSKNAEQQTDDTLENTWNFNEIKILPTFAKIKFGVSLTDVVTPQDLNPSPKTRVLVSANVGGSQGWGIIEQNNGSKDTVAADFTFITHLKGNNIFDHTKNTTIHITQEEKNLIYSLRDMVNQLRAEVDELKGNTTI